MSASTSSSFVQPTFNAPSRCALNSIPVFPMAASAVTHAGFPQHVAANADDFVAIAKRLASDLPRLVGNTKPGTKSSVTVFRRGSTRDLNVTVAEIEPDKPAKRTAEREEPSNKAPASAAAKSLGLAVADLTEVQKKELKLKGGVKIESSSEGASRAGLREGDVILAVGNIEVASVKEFESALAKIDRSKPVSVLFRRGDWAQYALIRSTR